jgi:hypothetical protein
VERSPLTRAVGAGVRKNDKKRTRALGLFAQFAAGSLVGCQLGEKGGAVAAEATTARSETGD